MVLSILSEEKSSTRNTTKSVRNVAKRPFVNAVDLTIHGTGDLAFDTLSATALAGNRKEAWCG